MIKEKQISIRVRKEQLNKIKDLGFKYSDCWELGFERICENEREELEKIVKKYHNLYTHANTKLQNFGKKQESEYKEIDRLLIWYKKRDTSIINPSNIDIDTVRYQMKKKDIHSFTVEQVFDYWRKKEGLT